MLNKIKLLAKSWQGYKRNMLKAETIHVLSQERYIKHGLFNSLVFNSPSGTILYQAIKIANVEVAIPSHFAPVSISKSKDLILDLLNSKEVCLVVSKQLSRLAQKLGFVKMLDVPAFFGGREINKDLLISRSLFISLMVALSMLPLMDRVAAIAAIAASVCGNNNTTGIVKILPIPEIDNEQEVLDLFDLYFWGRKLPQEWDLNPDIEDFDPNQSLYERLMYGK